MIQTNVTVSVNQQCGCGSHAAEAACHIGVQILPESCLRCACRGEQLTALQSTAISKRLHPFCTSISFCRSMQQCVVCSWAQAASLGCQAMLCSALQFWSLASRSRKTWHFGTAQGHTHKRSRLSSARPAAKQMQPAAATAGAARVAIGR